MVIWSNPAKADLQSIHDFIAHDSKHYAKKVTQDIAAKTDILNGYPQRAAAHGKGRARTRQ